LKKVLATERKSKKGNYKKGRGSAVLRKEWFSFRRKESVGEGRKETKEGGLRAREGKTA